MSDLKANRLREARQRAGFSSAQEAASAFGWQPSGYRHHENGTREYGADQAKRYARAFRVSPAWLLGLSQSATGEMIVGTRTVEVIGSVEAGIWQESWEWPREERFQITVGESPVPSARRFGLMVKGDSMNQIFPSGSILDCISIFDLEFEPENGDLVIVERINADGLREATVKEFLRTPDGNTWLLPKSTEPQFQQPIHVGQPDPDGDDVTSVQVVAFVVGSYQPHGQRFRTG